MSIRFHSRVVPAWAAVLLLAFCVARSSADSFTDLANAFTNTKRYGVYATRPSYVLKSHVVLRGPLPGIQGAGIDIRGNCTDSHHKATPCIIDGAGKYPFIAPLAGKEYRKVSLQNLVIRNTLGGAVIGTGSVLAVNVTFQDNTAATGGPAIRLLAGSFSSSAVSLIGCTFLRNSATLSDGGALWISGIKSASSSSSSNFSLTIARSSFLQNSAYGNGGAIWYTGPFLLLSKSLFNSNQAGLKSSSKAEGGALWAQSPSTSILSSQFLGNFASAGYGPGGAVYLVPSSTRSRALFCYSSFPIPSSEASKKQEFNAVFLAKASSAAARSTADFCPGTSGRPPHLVVAPGRPIPWTLGSNCSGCSGCPTDCSDNRGACALGSDQTFGCSCPIHYNRYRYCSECLPGYTTSSNCTACAGGYTVQPDTFTGKPTCGACAGYIGTSGNFPLERGQLRTSLTATNFTSCQHQCTADSLCRFWVFFDQSYPANCSGQCLLYGRRGGYCGPGVVPLTGSDQGRPWSLHFQNMQPSCK